MTKFEIRMNVRMTNDPMTKPKLGMWVFVWRAFTNLSRAATTSTAPGPARPEATPPCTLESGGASTQPAGLPVSFDVTITNTGRDSFYYWCGGPADYPQADHFLAELASVDAGGKPRPVECFNGQFEMGSGMGREIKPGASINVPLVIGPLAVGQYDIAFQSRQETSTDMTGNKTISWPAAQAMPLRVTIVEDAKLAAATRNSWVQRILGGEPLAGRMAIQFKTPEVIAKLVPALNANSDRAARNAADVLSDVEPADLPPGTDTAVASAIESGLQPRANATSAEPGLLIYLSMVAGNIGSDTALVAVAKLTHAENVVAEARWRAVQNLARFHQPQAQQELEALAKDKNQEVRSAAAIALAERQDPAAIPVLLDLIAAGPQFRAYQVEALGNFPNDPRAVAAIENATKDSDDLTRDFAQRAWQKVLAARNKPQPAPTRN
jgi:HEAT repeat protein